MNNTFTINILASGHRKTRYAEANKVLSLLLPIATLVLLAYGLYIFFYLPACEQIQRQQTTVGDLNLEVTQLSALQNKLEKQRSLYLIAAGERVDWSSKLLSLSLLTPKGVWINKLSFAKDERYPERSPVLEIYGQTISKSNQESLDKIAILIEKVNKASSFCQDFSPMEFIYSQLQDEQKGIMGFKLSSTVKEAQTGDSR